MTAILFVTAISEIDQVLVEDEKQNRLMESLMIFEDICNKPYFRNTSMILFLNKIDLFEEKIERVDLQELFPDYDGGANFEVACQFIRKQVHFQLVLLFVVCRPTGEWTPFSSSFVFLFLSSVRGAKYAKVQEDLHALHVCHRYGFDQPCV